MEKRGLFHGRENILDVFIEGDKRVFRLAGPMGTLWLQETDKPDWVEAG